ncbi:MAG: ABC transporter substrate-binding protein [Clostridiales bacterium]|nr:ABC transporter substrate-binding protein [Clostridiales bacterium]
MKKIVALLLAAVMLMSLTGALAATEYDVNEPITIEWWHAHESQFDEYIEYMVNKFNTENPYGITVVPVYKGSYTEINEQFIAADAAAREGAGTVPAICCCNTSYPAGYGAAGLCEVLDPYIEAFDYDVEDFGEGLVLSTSFDGEQICLPYLISTQCMYYNKTAAEAEGIEMPKTLDEMEDFLIKATIFNEDGTTARYGTVFGGWDYWYHEMLFKNNGVQIVTEEGTTDVNSEQSIAINTKIKEWIDKGYAYYAYGSGASSNMRDLFVAGGAFSVFHTSSLYTTYTGKVETKYADNPENAFEVGMAWLPGGYDHESFKSEVGGSCIFIPASATQAEKNAAWQFMMFMTSAEINLYWADKTGYFPTRASVKALPEYQEYLERKPAMADIINNAAWINPRNQNPAYDTCATLWRHALATIYNEGADVTETLNALAVEIQETLDAN